MLILPERPRRAALRAFVLSWGMLLVLVCVALGYLLSSVMLALFGASVSLALAAFLAVKPEKVRPLYDLWNGLCYLSTRILRFYLSLLSFYLVIFLSGRSGSRLTMKPGGSGDSGWVPRSTSPTSAYASPFGSVSNNGEGWLSAMMQVGTRPENVWTLALIPIIGLLRLCDTKAEEHSPANIYTLF